MFNISFFSKKYRCFLTVFCVTLLSFINVFAQVNLPTGAAQVNIPLYNYSDKNRLSLSLALQYADGNGVKVNELASIVGLGWNLNFGGSVSRIVAGKPDDQYANFPANRLNTGRLYSN
jgi:hypothetical protein